VEDLLQASLFMAIVGMQCTTTEWLALWGTGLGWVGLGDLLQLRPGPAGCLHLIADSLLRQAALSALRQDQLKDHFVGVAVTGALVASIARQILGVCNIRVCKCHPMLWYFHPRHCFAARVLGQPPHRKKKFHSCNLLSPL
jgi:hypothetical protein